MGVYKGVCPKCGSTEITKERISGMQTGDLVCIQCNFSYSAPSFNETLEADKKKETSSNKR